jgi:hypothetical protein
MILHRTLKIGFRILLASVFLASAAHAQAPKPSPYPISWQFKFEHSTPKRVMVKVPGINTPQAFWYMTYTVTNNTSKEEMFLPAIELLTRDGRVIRSDVNIPAIVFDAIKTREKKQFLEPYPKIAGELRIGEDQARDGVAIWPEPMPEMGRFSIFVGGLSGEAVMYKDSKGEPVKSADGKPVILRKTLQLNFLVRGDELQAGDDPVTEQPSEWVMR